MKTKSKRDIGIDALRLICALMVVFIHIEKEQTFYSYLSDVFRIATPIFFMVTGYYFIDLYSNCKIKKQIMKILILLFFSNVFYFAYYLFRHALDASINEWINYLINNHSLVDILLFNVNPMLHRLWFINAMLYVLLFAYLFEKLNIGRYICKTSIILLIINLVIGSYSLVFFGKEISEVYCRNFILMGVPYFYIGYYINKNKEKIHLEKRKNIILIIVFSMFNILEIYLLRKFDLYGGREMFIFTPFLAIIVLYYFLVNCTNNPTIIKLSNWGRKYSLYIYLLHKFVQDIIKILISKVLILSHFEFTLTAIGSLAASFIVYKIVNMIKIKKNI